MNARGMVLVALVAGSAGTAQAAPELPEDLERALSMVSSIQLRLRCDITAQARIPERDLFRRWSVGGSVTRGRAQTYVIAGERVHYIQERRASDPLRLDADLQRELAFDGAEVRYSARAETVSIHSQASLQQAYGKERKLYQADYFDAVRVSLPNQPSRIGALPGSEVLKSLYHGATFEFEGASGLWRVHESRAEDEEILTWLDPAHAFAVVRWEKRRGGQTSLRVVNSELFDAGPTWLPARIELTFHSWHTVPGDISDDPLLTRTIRVTDFSRELAQGDLEMRERQSGSSVIDGRYAGYDAGRDGHILYHVSVDPDELQQRFAKAWAGRAGEADRWRGLARWIAWHLLGLAAWTVLMRIRPLRGWRRTP